MNKATKLAAAALLSLSAIALSATAASAAIACNGEGNCWHVRKTYNYKPEFGVTIHPNNWRWGPNDHYTWREHAGRGYWKNGVWIKF